MKRVLHIVNIMNRGGLETFIMNVYRKIDRTKIQFDFMVHSNIRGEFDDEIESLGGIIFRITSRRENIVKNRKELELFFYKHPEYTIVHQHSSSLSYLTPLKIAKKHKVPTRIIHSHSSKLSGNKLNYLTHYFNQFLLNNISTDNFACSKLAAKWLFGKNNYLNDNYRIINNGIDIEEYKFDILKRNKIRKEFKIENNIKVIGHVGRFTYPKNHSYLIDVFNELSKIEKKTKLILVGSGRLKEEIQSKVEELNLSEKVLFLGQRSDVADILSAMDVLVFPSHYEGLPVSLVEAQATGLRVLASQNITEEIKLTNLLEFMSIHISPQKWAIEIKNINNYTRKDTHSEIKNHNYDINQVVKKLEYFYLNVDKRERGKNE